ncbi:MAG: ZIP family metal transporter [Candidatus Nomurabacteria bacterium]|jgi:zinc and cadmium transporter|nr:ZIP family metal transporter [Candidatus Nomurabacteria bacterium]
MPIILQVFLCSLTGGLVSLTGGLILLASKKRMKWAEYATAFAAGALLASALIDMLPEAIEEGGDVNLTATFVLIGVVVFFLMEVFLTWFHKHGERNNEGHEHKESTDPVVPMIIMGDAIHNFIDGMAIAAGFLISPASGVVVTLAVAAHEIPQEVGDFGLLLHKGVRRRKVLLVNVLSSLVTVVAAMIFFLIGDTLNISFMPALGLVAGFFIYIAASDIIPSIHSDRSHASKTKKALLLVAGILTVWVAITVLHGVMHEYTHDQRLLHLENGEVMSIEQ